MNYNLLDDKLSDTDQVSPNAEEQYVEPVFQLKRRNKEQEKEIELLAKQQKEALLAIPMTEDQIDAQKLLLEQEAGQNLSKRSTNETTSLES